MHYFFSESISRISSSFTSFSVAIFSPFSTLVIFPAASLYFSSSGDLLLVLLTIRELLLRQHVEYEQVAPILKGRTKQVRKLFHLLLSDVYMSTLSRKSIT